METSFDFSIIPRNQLEFEIYKLEYDKLDENSKLAVEILHNSFYNNNIIEIDYSIKKVCILLKLHKINYKNLPHKYKINELVINTFIDVITEIETKEKNTPFHDEIPDLLFEDNYLPIILIYNKDFIIKLLQIKTCNIFYNYKMNFPESFLLTDFDVNKNALNNECSEPNCYQHNILNDIDQTHYNELFDYFLEKNPNFIRWINELEFDINIEIIEKHILICLDNDPSLHHFLQNKYGLPDDCLTLEYILNLIDKNVDLDCIAIPLHLETLEIYTRAVSNNGLNIRYVPQQFINDELIQIAITRTSLANLVIPIEYIQEVNLDYIFDSINIEDFQKLCLYTNLKERYSYFSEEQLLIICGANNDITRQKITNIMRSNQDFTLRYVKYRGFTNFFLQSVNINYEILSYMNIDEYEYIHNIDLDKISYMNYLIRTKNTNQIKNFISYTNDLPIDMMYELVLLDKIFIIYFEEKYWDGKIITKYEEYLIRNSKNYMYLYVYLRSISIDTKFIQQNILSFLTNNYFF